MQINEHEWVSSDGKWMVINGAIYLGETLVEPWTANFDHIDVPDEVANVAALYGVNVHETPKRLETDWLWK